MSTTDGKDLEYNRVSQLFAAIYGRKRENFPVTDPLSSAIDDGIEHELGTKYFFYWRFTGKMTLVVVGAAYNGNFGELPVKHGRFH